MDLIKRSPYHHKFVELGATFVDRLGFAAPMVFTSIEEEHRATREAVGVFDVYYQVAVEVAGRDAEAFLQARGRRGCRGSRRSPRGLHVAVQRSGRDDRRPHLLSPVAASGTGCFRRRRALQAVLAALSAATVRICRDRDQSRLQERVPVDPGPALAAPSRRADRRGSLDRRVAVLLVHRSDGRRRAGNAVVAHRLLR